MRFYQLYYVVYRNDHGGRGGGVLLAVKSKISSTLIYSPTHLELLTVTLNHTKVITISVCYISYQTLITNIYGVSKFTTSYRKFNYAW